MKRLIIVSILLLLISCDPHDGRLVIVNNSQDTIFWNLSNKKEEKLDFPTTFDKDGSILFDRSSIILPDSNDRSFMIGRNGWEDFINEECEDSVLRLFFFDQSLITSVPWDTILAKKMYSHSVELSVDDLEKQNWEVIYNKKRE